MFKLSAACSEIEFYNLNFAHEPSYLLTQLFRTC